MPLWPGSNWFKPTQLELGGSEVPEEETSVSEDPEEVLRLKATLSYDGTPYRGFAIQNGQHTVAGSIKAALEKVTGAEEIEIVCAGRTDAGVHASCQVIHVDLKLGDSTRISLKPEAESLVKVRNSLNKLLGPSIAVSALEVAGDGFNARFSAKARRYRYTILNGEVPDPFLASTSWLVKHPLALHALETATYPLIGEHDFRSFCRRPPDKGPCDPIIRRVISAEWSIHSREDYCISGDGQKTSRLEIRSENSWSDALNNPPGLRGTTGRSAIFTFEIEASSFCHQMVRSIVGTLVDMGVGRRKPSEMRGIIDAHDRAYASSPAPASGLSLIAVRY